MSLTSNYLKDLSSRYARNLYERKIKRIFEIARADFEIILFIHFHPLKKALGQSQRHFLKNFLKKNTFGLKNFWVPFWYFSERLICHFLTYAWKSKKIGAFSKWIMDKFLAYLEPIRSYVWSNGHLDPDPSSVLLVLRACANRKELVHFKFLFNEHIAVANCLR